MSLGHKPILPIRNKSVWKLDPTQHLGEKRTWPVLSRWVQYVELMDIKCFEYGVVLYQCVAFPIDTKVNPFVVHIWQGDLGDIFNG